MRDLHLLPFLHALLATGSVTRSAQRLGVSQPTVSRALAQLRTLLGDPLLIKTNSGMALTKRAEALRLPVDRWTRATEQLWRGPPADDGATRIGTVRIAANDYGVLSVLTPAMPTIMVQAPDLTLEVLPRTVDPFAQMASGAVDIVLTGHDPEPGRACERLLFTDGFTCVVRPDHPVLATAADGRIGLTDYARWPHIVTNIDWTDGDPMTARLAEHGLKRRIALRLPYFSVTPHMILTSDAIVMLPGRVAASFCRGGDLVAFDAPLEPGRFSYWLLWHERVRRDATVKWLIDRLAEAVAK